MNTINKYIKYKNKFDFIGFSVPIIDLIVPIKYSPNQKYDNKYFLICLMDFVSSCTSWSKYRGTIDHPINGRYLNKIYYKFIKHNVYNEINRQILEKYLKTGKEYKLKYQMIDSSFIANKGGSIKNNNHLLNDETKKKK